MPRRPAGGRLRTLVRLALLALVVTAVARALRHWAAGPNAPASTSTSTSDLWPPVPLKPRTG